MISTMFHISTAILAVVFFCMGLFLILMNWWCVIEAILGNKQSSWVPLLGGIFASLGMALFGEPYCDWWFIPFIVDYGSVPGVFHTLIWWIFQGRAPTDGPR